MKNTSKPDHNKRFNLYIRKKLDSQTEVKLMSCKYCKKDAIYRCNTCGTLTCAEHTKLQTLCPPCTNKTTLNYTINKATLNKERKKIQEFVKKFWGEQEQLTFNKKFTVAKLPAYVAKYRNTIIGFISFAEVNDAIIIVALGILPKYQNAGIGKSLIKKVETEDKKLGKKKLLVSTSNDDLPALAFYQSLGFQIYEVKPNIIAQKHGSVLKGINGLPIRDELRLQKILK
jgi:ribosomal protein S18 acetylase RimI-like enzyme